MEGAFLRRQLQVTEIQQRRSKGYEGSRLKGQHVWMSQAGEESGLIRDQWSSGLAMSG